MSDRHSNRPDAFATRVVAVILCLAAVSAPTEASSAPASPIGTNVPAATLGNTNEQATWSEMSETNMVHRLDYASFKIIHERNIFNANRSRRREGRGERTRPAKVETFSLVGTMSYAKGDFAFFDGSSSSYRKAVKINDSVAGYKVTDVLPNAVKLETNGKTLELRVGAHMRREDEGGWELVASSIPNVSAPTAAKDGERSDSDSGDDNEALKRLLQRREAEENK